MAENVIQTACPNCGQVYELPGEYLGQNAECEACGISFVIQAEVKSVNEEKETEKHNPMSDTNTTRIPRMRESVNMVPQVDDQFSLNVVQTTGRAGTTGTVTGAPGARKISGGTRAKKKPWWKLW